MDHLASVVSLLLNDDRADDTDWVSMLHRYNQMHGSDYTVADLLTILENMEQP
ncbi:hypothetical protein [Endozoicomonas atrinae]|uniref:hypothetical protein n=1 Tax=Endozoicomonas atrinae TaxID=1333660 RepID=UPI000A89CC99|nr:hypothetical protein [Endozoicomonas atrinae]